jgi:hypothetical protein
MSINIVTQLGTNAGKSVGDIRMGSPKVLILTRGFELAAADLADSDSLLAAVAAAMRNSRTSANKLFVFTGFREAEDNTGDPQEQSLQDGFTEILVEALAKYTLKHTAGVAQTQSFVEFNGWNDGVYVLDSKNVFWYRNKSNGGGTYFSVGSLYSTYPRFGNTGAINTGLVKLTLGDADDLKGGGLSCIKVDSSFVKNLPNIVDVSLSEGTTATGYAFKIVAKRKYTGTNIYEAYKDLLNVVGAWKITLADGTVVTVASVAKDATLDGANGGWTVTAASSPTISSGAVMYIELVDPAALHALGTPVEGIESIKVKVAKP